MFEEEEKAKPVEEMKDEPEIQSYQPQVESLDHDFSFEPSTQVIQDHGGGAKVIEDESEHGVIAVFPVEQDNRYKDHRMRADSNLDDPFFKHMPSEVNHDPADLLDDEDDKEMREDIESIEDNFYKSKH